MIRYYAGIGSRKTPDAYLRLMTEMAVHLGLQGMTLRSGGAEGADTAFERGAHGARTGCKTAPFPEIYMPWGGFNRDDPQRLGFPPSRVKMASELSGEAVAIARENHPNWKACTPAARWMHTRNVAQVLGADCRTPVEFVLCWTPKGSGSGGTGQAIRIARSRDIPVYDLGDLALPFVRRRLADVHGVKV